MNQTDVLVYRISHLGRTERLDLFRHHPVARVHSTQYRMTCDGVKAQCEFCFTSPVPRAFLRSWKRGLTSHNVTITQ